MTSPVAPSAKQVPKKVRITNGADSGMNSIGRLLFALALLRCPLSTARCGIRDAAEASLASAKLCNRQVKILGAEFRPHARSFALASDASAASRMPQRAVLKG